MHNPRLIAVQRAVVEKGPTMIPSFLAIGPTRGIVFSPHSIGQLSKQHHSRLRLTCKIVKFERRSGKMGQEESGVVKKHKKGSIRSLFIHAHSVDLWLMALGFLGSVGDGFTTPLVLLICSRLMNNIGGASFPVPQGFEHDISKIVSKPETKPLRQGLAKGLAIGSNGVVFAIWSFMSYYGSRLVMYHGAQGGTVFVVGASIAMGGLALGAGLSNMKYFAEATSAGERIMEVLKRVPKIDSDNMGGEILEHVSGNVEFKHIEFAYPSRPESIILKDFCLEIPAGQTVALVGGSGSGKSTGNIPLIHGGG
ncbi:putative multidrug resistance protein [Morella rubra]|uniref:Putative multidrug resistance protein n=1 Tax=Morella rubra TaxID=262757 RepID=A0A6A1VGD2_9ROSI|nr:putative multidrug resistance protein [Morella rubra]